MKKRLAAFSLVGICLIMGLSCYSYQQSQDEINQIKAFWKAERAARERNFDQAMVFYQQITAYRLNNDVEREAVTSIAGIMRKMDENKALDLCSQIIKLYPNTIDELIALSRMNEIYQKQNKTFDLNAEYKKRIEQLQKQVQTTNDRELTAKSLIQMGRIYSALKDRDKENQCIQEVVNKYSGTTASIGAYIALASYYTDTAHQDYSKAVQLLYVVVTGYRMYPRAVDARFFLASILLFDLHKDKEALTIVNDIKKNFPYDRYTPRVYYFLANYYASKKDYAKAIDYNEQVIKKYPETHNALVAERAIPVLKERLKEKK
ncbi:MAG: tetratricopeptide repeat protein [bacterium]